MNHNTNPPHQNPISKPRIIRNSYGRTKHRPHAPELRTKTHKMGGKNSVKKNMGAGGIQGQLADGRRGELTSGI
jgi:hypothetical protein